MVKIFNFLVIHQKAYKITANFRYMQEKTTLFLKKCRFAAFGRYFCVLEHFSISLRERKVPFCSLIVSPGPAKCMFSLRGVYKVAHHGRFSLLWHLPQHDGGLLFVWPV